MRDWVTSCGVKITRVDSYTAQHFKGGKAMTAAALTIDEYFALRFNHKYLRKFGAIDPDVGNFNNECRIDTPCGRMCAHAIDTGALLVDHIQGATNSQAYQDQVAKIAWDICITYWRG